MHDSVQVVAYGATSTTSTTSTTFATTFATTSSMFTPVFEYSFIVVMHVKITRKMESKLCFGHVQREREGRERKKEREGVFMGL